ncbi:transposable element Tc1 transposase [Trichonephila clavipes]|nr:transposable element Tc1 transposase [Trichonephila clavipes]
MPRGRHRTSFDQVSKFDQGRIAVYRKYGLTFREIGQHVGRKKATAMRIYHRWMQEETMDRRGRLHPPRYTTDRDDSRIVCMVVMDRAATSQQIQSVTRHSVSARTIRCRLQQNGTSVMRSLLRLPLTEKHRRFCRQWCVDWRTWTAEWNDIVLTDESRFCLQHHDDRIRVTRHRGERLLNCCVMHRHTGLAPGIMIRG